MTTTYSFFNIKLNKLTPLGNKYSNSIWNTPTMKTWKKNNNKLKINSGKVRNTDLYVTFIQLIYFQGPKSNKNTIQGPLCKIVYQIKCEKENSERGTWSVKLTWSWTEASCSCAAEFTSSSFFRILSVTIRSSTPARWSMCDPI
jgi:hypothetical protein